MKKGRERKMRGRGREIGEEEKERREWGGKGKEEETKINYTLLC